MKKRASVFIIIGLFSFISACKDSRSQEVIISSVNAAFEPSGNNENKTLLVVSSADCGNCFVTELEEFLKTEKLDATLVVSFEERKAKELDKKVIDLLTENAIPVFKKESLSLLVEIGKYSGSPKSPYILRYGNRNLQIESLVRH
ncbi:MAG: hypothetical protein HEP71_12505 [Roseivirga sp.]|nr:hypothetical protein [Roseivirga sp.]